VLILLKAMLAASATCSSSSSSTVGISFTLLMKQGLILFFCRHPRGSSIQDKLFCLTYVQAHVVAVLNPASTAQMANLLPHLAFSGLIWLHLQQRTAAAAAAATAYSCQNMHSKDAHKLTSTCQMLVTRTIYSIQLQLKSNLTIALIEALV
jgi:hypothetical protein